MARKPGRKLLTNKELAEMLSGTGKRRYLSFKTKIIDHGYEEFAATLEQVERDQPSVTIGVHAAAGMHAGDQKKKRPKRTFRGPIQQVSPVYVAEVAWWNEMGTKRIPERSFMRSTWDENLRKYEKIVEKLILLIYMGKQDVIGSLHILGLKIESDIKRKITTLKIPANAPSTIARKGSSNPLIDTGQLRASIRYVVNSEDKPKEE